MNDWLLDAPQTHADSVAAWAAHLGRPSVDPHALRRTLSAGPTLAIAFARAARRWSTAPALTIGEVTLSHGEVEHESLRLASSMSALQVGPGSVVMISADTRFSVVLAYLAALRLGATVAFVHSSSTPEEITRATRASAGSIAFGTGNALGSLVDADTGVPVVGLEPNDQQVVSTIAGMVPGPDVAPSPTDASTAAVLAFTSGTTGAPKLVPLSHRNLLASIRGVLGAWRWRQSDVLVHSLPIGHQHGLGGIHAALLTGSHTVLLPRFEPSRLIETIRERQATVMFAVPAIYSRLVEDAPDSLPGLRALRLITSGSAPLPSDLALRIEEVVGQVPVERYGSTEAGLDVSNPYIGPRLPGTVGLALPGVEMVIVDDNLRPAAADTVGEVVLRGPQVFDGYRGVAETDTFVGGWFRTGDLGLIEATSGHLRLVGRKKDLIITGGMNVYPREIEGTLRATAGITDAAVVGIPSKRWGEAVVAFVTMDPVDERAVWAAIERTLAPYKRPKRIVFAEHIPRNQLGKLVVDELRFQFPEVWESSI